MTKFSVDLCPVPTEQQPANEYEQLKESWFFRWATLNRLGYSRKLIWVWFWGWIVAGPIAAASFSPTTFSLKFVLCGAAGAGIFVVLTVLRLYLGWLYVRDRLQSDTVAYEESGWYDGQNWEKPTTVQQRDRLIVTYQVNPILQRLKRSFAILALLIAIGSLIWLLS
ncbi:MAG: CGLD27 family protein [Cyanobacteriota bacterium]